MGRYDRQELITGWRQDVVSSSRVLVVGAGTTGNEVIKNLVLLGIGNISVIDFDTIEEVNLSRSVLFRDCDIGKSKALVAAVRGADLNPKISVVGIDRDVIFAFGSGQYSKFDCVVTTVDNLEARMWVNRYCRLNDVTLIDTGVSGTLGNVFISNGSSTACLECTWPESNYTRLSERYSCLKIGLTPEGPNIPMVITSASVIAGIAVHECAQALHDKANNLLVSNAGCFRWINLAGGAFLTWRHDPKPDCDGCDCSRTMSRTLPLTASINDSVTNLKATLLHILRAEAVELWGDKEIVYSEVCGFCNTNSNSNPVALGRFQRKLCSSCHQVSVIPNEHTAELKDGYSLRELGVPECHHISVVFSSAGEIGKTRLIIS